MLYQVGFKIKRKVGGFSWNGSFIILILVLMCFSTFSVEFSDMASGLNVLTAILRTMVALKTVLQANAPVTPRANCLDVYLNSGIFLNDLSRWRSLWGLPWTYLARTGSMPQFGCVGTVLRYLCTAAEAEGL